MAKKERNRRSARQARSAARAEREQVELLSEDKPKGGILKKAESTATTKPEKKASKPGLFSGIRNYIAAVRTEMRKVVWPSPEELRNYTFSTIVILIIAGVVVWLVDTGIVAGLLAVTGLRG